MRSKDHPQLAKKVRDFSKEKEEACNLWTIAHKIRTFHFLLL